MPLCPTHKIDPSTREYGGVNIFTNFQNFMGAARGSFPRENRNRLESDFCAGTYMDDVYTQCVGLDIDMLDG